MGYWDDMSCMERITRVLAILAVVVLLANLAINIYFCYAASNDGWFTPCSHCTQNCGNCCNNCTTATEAFFYIMRIYNFIFIIIGLVAEMRIETFDECFKACIFMLPRGFMQVFIGVLTVTASLPNPSGAAYFAIGGYALIGVGALYTLAGLACYNEYDAEARKNEITSNGARTTTASSSEPRPSNAANEPTSYDYTYNGQTFTYGASTERSAI